MLAVAAALVAAPPALGQARDSVPPDSAVRMPAIVVTATRSELVRDIESPAAARTDTARAADRAASRVTADLLRDAPGVHVQQTSAGQGAVVLRGLVGNQVLLLVDGIPLNNGTYRDGPGQYLATIDPETIERIEVVRGPASVLYGSDAQGGVVNIITQPHPGALGLSLGGAVQASSATMGGRARLSAGYGSGTVQVRAGFTLQAADDLRAGPPVGAQDPTGFDALGADTRVDWAPAGSHQLTVGVQHWRMADVPRYDRYWNFRAPDPGPDVDYALAPQARQLGFLQWSYHSVTPALRHLTATASVAVQQEDLRRRRRRGDGTPAPTIQYTEDHVLTPGLSVVGESQFAAVDRPVTLTWGSEGYHDVVDARGEVRDLTGQLIDTLTRSTASGPIPTGRFPDGATMTRAGVFLEADAPVVDGVRLSAGARWSGTRAEAEVGTELGGRVENTTSALTAQGGTVVRVATPIDLVARIAQGFRAPNLYDLTNLGAVPGGVVVPNPDVRAERSLTYEAGVRAHTTATAGELVAYRTLIHDFIDRVPAAFNGDTLLDGQRVYQGQNVGEARLWGLEAEVGHRIGPIQARGTVLYTYGDQRLGDGTVEPMSKIPPLSGIAEVRWTATDGRLWTAYRLSWATRQDRLSSRDLTDTRIEPGGTPGYTAHAVVAGASLPGGITLSAGLENLTDALYRTHASGVDSPGRHVWVGMSVYGEP
jgi:outer membrane receptor protein involved in Fe transport